MYTLSLLLLCLFSLFIAAFSFVRWDASWLRALDTIPVQILLILIGVTFLGAAFFLLTRILKKLSPGKLKGLTFLCFLILAAGQLGFLFLVRPMLRYDALKTFDMAVEMLSSGTISGTYETGYFARYTNNYPITILTYWFLKLLTAVSIPQSYFMVAVQLVNIGCLLLSIWLGFKLLLEYRTQQTAVLYLLLCVFCPLSYVWAGFYYTTTLSMPCMMGLLYLWPRLLKAKTQRKQISLATLFGILLILGYKLRATAMIAFLAILIVLFLKLWKLRPAQRLVSSIKNTCSSGKKYLPQTAAFFLSVLLSLGFWNGSVERYVNFDYQNTGFPMIHWVAMGARWDGAFDQNDELYTSSFETKEEKIEANKEVLLERIQDAGPAGLLSLLGRKLLNTWADGTDGYLPENSFRSFSRLSELLLGNESGFVTLYSQIFRTLTMLVIGFGALFSLLRLYRKKQAPALFSVQLTLLGTMAFHLLWETNPLYSVGCTFLMLLLLADGITIFSEEKQDTLLLRQGHLICTGALCLLLLFLVAGKKELVETPIEKKNYCVDQYQYAGASEGLVASYDQSYVQTFTANRPFNRIAVRCINPVGPYNQSAFTVKLTSADGTILYENDRFLSGMVTASTSYEFDLGDTIMPEGETLYTLEIAPGYIHGEDSLEFLTYTTENYDMYPGGTLTVAEEEQKNGDLAFSVYEYEITTYFSSKMYLILAGAIFLLCGGITAGMWERKCFTFSRKKPHFSRKISN